MNKLEELHEKATVSEAAEITTDVAIKFAEWLDKKCYVRFAIYKDQKSQTEYKYTKWDKSYKHPSDIVESETKTTKELFEEAYKYNTEIFDTFYLS